MYQFTQPGHIEKEQPIISSVSKIDYLRYELPMDLFLSRIDDLMEGSSMDYAVGRGQPYCH